MTNLVVLDDVAPIRAVAEVDGVVRHVLNPVMADHVALAQPQKNAGNVLVVDPAMVNVVVHDLVVDGIPLRQLGVLVVASNQADADGSPITEFVALNDVALVESFG